MRYEAMVNTGPRGWQKKLDLDGRPFAIWDYNIHGWWKGYSTGSVSYKHFDSAQKRAAELNEGIYKSNYVPKIKEETEATFARFWHAGVPSSHWFRVDNEVTLVVRRNGDKHIWDTQHSELRDFYQYNWSGDGGKVREGWLLQIKIVSHVGGEETIHEQRTITLEDAIAERLGFHETIKLCHDLGAVQPDNWGDKRVVDVLP